MTYQPLARVYRPSRFSELIGQDAVALALSNSIITGRVLANLIFTGVRGVGKTTVARLYAKALNCEARTPGSAEPCNACASCLAIARGNHEDVLEIDGASNTGVGDVRALQETIEYAAQRSPFKVYIIDEVHMLSAAAFNALLKTLEERHPHVIFVFATTELSRVPETILSRCPTFHLKKMPVDLIIGQMRSILAKEKIEAEDAALAIIAREGHGSMRDALTLLDQAIALGAGRVTMDSLGPMVSHLSSSPYLSLLEALVARDAKAAMGVVSQLDLAGAEFPDVAEALAGFARHAFVLKDLGADALEVSLLGLDDGEKARLAKIAAVARPFDLNRIFRTLVKCRLDLSGEALDRFIFENYIFEWCFDPGLPDLATLMNSTSNPAANAGTNTLVHSPQAGSGEPRRVSLTAPQGTTPPAAAPVQTRVAAPAPGPARTLPPQNSSPVTAVAAAPVQVAAKVEGATAKAPPIFPASWRELVDAWKRDKPLQARKLEETHLMEFSREKIVIAVADDAYASKALLQRDEQTRLKETFRELFGFNGQLVVIPHAEAQRAATHALPETLVDVRAKESEERRKKVLDEAREAPFTQAVVGALGGKIEAVRPLR